MVNEKAREGAGFAEKPSQPASNDHSERYPKLLGKGFPLLWFAIVAFILFGQSVSFRYTYLDDQTLILNNLDKLKSASILFTAFGEDAFHSPAGHGFYYRPILTISFMADAIVGNGSFAMFHFSNILYHILATFLLFLFFAEAGFGRIRSFVAGMLFLVHPMVTQAVAWVPGRNDSLLAIFILGSFLFWLKYLKRGNNRYVMLHLLFYLLALLTKENAFVLPGLIVFYGFAMRPAPLKKYSIAGTGWVIITVGWAVLRYLALGGLNGVPVSIQLLSIAKNLPAVLPFLGKALFPFDLSVFPVLTDMKVSVVLGVIAIALLAGLVAVTKPKQWLIYSFGLLWFLAFLVPSFVSINNQIPNFSEHRSYLSLVGIFIIFMVCTPVNKADFTRMVPIAAVAGICLLFGVLTYLHTRHFKDQFAFWQNAVDTSPSNAFNYNNLGAMYFLNENLEKAEPLFRKALQINPYEPMANSNTGLVCMRTERVAEAEKYYLEEIRINPTYENAYYNLGLLYFNHSHPEEGISLWERTLVINPAYPDAYQALLFAYGKMGRKEDYERIASKAKENGLKPTQ